MVMLTKLTLKKLPLFRNHNLSLVLNLNALIPKGVFLCLISTITAYNLQLIIFCVDNRQKILITNKEKIWKLL